VVVIETETLLGTFEYLVLDQVRSFGAILSGEVLLPIFALLHHIDEEDSPLVVHVCAMGRQLDSTLHIGVVHDDGLLATVHNVRDEYDAILEQQIHVVLEHAELVIPLFENEQVDALAQVPVKDFVYLLWLLSQLFVQQVAIVVDELINQDFQILKHQSPVHAILRNTDCLKLVNVWFVTFENRNVSWVVLCFWVWDLWLR
jgi:hypothetical protein